MGTGKNIRHDLRTPLNHIIGYSEMLLDEIGGVGAADWQIADLSCELASLRGKGRELLELVNRPTMVDDEHLAGVFGDWRSPLLELTFALRRLRPRFAEHAAGWLSDLDKVEQATSRLRALFEAIDGPLGEPPEAGRAVEPVAVAVSITRGNTDKGRLLVVDDNESNVEILQRRLVQQGYSVSTAMDGATALHMIDRERFDIVLLDVLMPGISGIEVLKSIRERFAFHQLPVIMVTAKHGSENIVEALHLGANDYITKPVDFPVALARISTQIYLRHVTRDLAEANDRLHRYSYIDGLTGIANRRNFDECVKREWGSAHREQQPFSLILLDVDYFKLYNDNYGHDAGDKVLVRIAEALAKALYRPGDLIARYGGEEFVAVLPRTPTNVAVVVAERLRAAVAALNIPHDHHRTEPRVTVSLGVAGGFPDETITADQLRVSADQALYRAKHLGRNRFGCGGNLGGRCLATQCVAAPHACHSND